MKRKIKERLPSNIVRLALILICIIAVFIISRLITYFVLVYPVIPGWVFLNITGFRLHHFVYGNIIITLTSFFAIGLGIRKHRNLFAVFYGIGLGLVLDEFLLWMGDVAELNRNVMWIPHSLTAISLASITIATIIMIRLYELHKFHINLKLK